MTALLFGLRHHHTRNVPTSAHPAAKRGKQQIRIARTAVQRACEDNNPAAAARALLQWAAASWPDDPPRNLGALMRRLSTGVNELQMLEQTLYGTAGEPWQGDTLWRVFDSGLQTRIEHKPASKEGLSPLYPDWNT